jgi:hypothetical protein
MTTPNLSGRRRALFGDPYSSLAPSAAPKGPEKPVPDEERAAELGALGGARSKGLEPPTF